MWLGHGFKGMAAHFINHHYEDYASASDHREGMIRVSGVVWFTNLDHAKRHRPLILTEKYSPGKYATYDNYNAINVDKTKDIPCDYYGIIGVPVTYLDKHCPEQFEIVGCDYDIKEGLLPWLVRPEWEGKLDRGYVGGVRLYSRILIKRKPCG